MPAIKTIEVATGIHWVEIPEADLRILCGCPADSVKHLMKKGLIVSEDLGGVQAETGPNAILLSDSLIQGGAFSQPGGIPGFADAVPPGHALARPSQQHGPQASAHRLGGARCRRSCATSTGATTAW